MKNLLAVFGLAAVAALPFMAIAQQQFNPDDANTILDAVFDAIAHGRADLAVVLLLVIAVAVVRKSLSKLKLTAVESDIGGTLLNFIIVMGIMVAGPMAAGAHLSVALLRTAALAAFTTAGGFTFVKRIVMVLLPVLHPLFEKLPVGGLIEWFVKRWAKDEQPPKDPPDTGGAG